MLPRAYPPRDLRQQDADRLVTTEDELRSVITAALSGNAVANVRLGADIFLTSTILVPLSSALRGLQFDGCGRYGIFATGSMTAIFTVASLTSKVGNVASAPLAFAGITLGAKTFNLFALFDGVTGGAGPLFSTLQMTHVRLTNTLNFVNTSADHPASFTFSTFVDVTASNSITGAALSIGGIATDSAFFAVKSNFTWALSSASARCCFVDCPGVESLASSLLAGPNTIIGRSSRSLIPSDLLLGGSLALAPSSATLSSAGPTLTPGSSSFMRLTFTAGASGNVTVATGFDGQILRLYSAAVAGTAVFTSGAGNLLLNSTFTPTLGAVLELQYDNATSTWVEVARSSAGGAPTGASYVTITNDATLTNERALAVTSPLALADGGANAAVTLSVGDATGAAKGVLQLAKDLGGTAALPQVTGLLGSALAASAADGFIKRNTANTAWETVGYGTAADTVAQGNAVAPIGSSFITIANDATLTNERALAVSAPATLVDAGANSTVTIGVADASTTVKGAVKLAQDLAGSALLPQVIGLFGSPLAAMSPDGFVKRNAANTAWESVAFGSAADTVTQGNDARLLVGAEGGYGQNFLRSSLPANNGGFLMVTGNAMFVYLGRVATTRTVNFVKFFLTVVGAGAQTAEVGLFSSPAAPNGANQTLTKLAANGTLDSLTVGTGLKGNTVGMAQSVTAGTHLWAGLRCALVTTQPTIGGVGFDYAQGHIMTFASAAAFTATASYAATIIAAANNAAQAPGLMGYP